MPINVIYPKVSLEMTNGRISRWLVADGDTVNEGQVLFEIDNDKAAVEVESPASGVIGDMVKHDIEVEVGAGVARIFATGEVAVSSEVAASLSFPAPTRPAAAPARAPEALRKGPNPTPLARRIARENGVSLEGVPGTGPRGRVQKKDVLEKLVPANSSVPLASPTPVNEAKNMASAPSPTTETTRLHTTWLRRGTGIPFVLLHGFGADLNNWRGMLAGLRHDWPVLAVDLPAHGKSSREVPQDLDRMAAQVETVLAGEGIEPLILVGHSFGGALATRLAARGMLDIRGLCLFAPAGLGPEINASFLDGLLRANSASSLRPWLELLAYDPATISDGFLQAVVEQRRDEGLTTAMRQLSQQFFPDGTQSVSIRSDLTRLKSLVRVVFGRQDRILPFSYTHGLPGNVALHALDHCGHMPHLEQPELAAAILEDIRRGI
ncbi:acetoin dehydrogenase dihydrolipoyllysine-residue acetyltransferase subunit [Agrobacterium sp. T29]|uniref:acetoin dehydrogenase dihydrolipoyllysine-residue acetyltransferase subunit n=1 Tax=Agrobacterium sp. T29 TaxID=2580515 RepID=UPI00115C6EB4|nr:acetoin dehydrogenase dihydrolipoyllysine-residue acetyltransferase subunit [Agrobacterium sp. T29]